MALPFLCLGLFRWLFEVNDEAEEYASESTWIGSRTPDRSDVDAPVCAWASSPAWWVAATC
ncbi:hypothetical protein [Microbacterium sp. NPDC076895]|uniref:hypothetical protein n=1 Tax=Microbacterium sp. NPDC076895 TaxID=3154957 RepID=UPI00343DC3CA